MSRKNEKLIFILMSIIKCFNFTPTYTVNSVTQRKLIFTNMHDNSVTF